MGNTEMGTPKQKPLHAAYENCDAARHHLSEIGAICMEVLEDKRGILVERWLVGKRSMILFSTPIWWNVFPEFEEPFVDRTLEFITQLAKKE
jgi:hypothetical protein